MGGFQGFLTPLFRLIQTEHLLSKMTRATRLGYNTSTIEKASIGKALYDLIEVFKEISLNEKQ